MKQLLGIIANKLNIKSKLIHVYERFYDWIRTIQMYLLKPFDDLWKYRNQLKIRTIDETIDLIINKKYSVARFGDGEFKLLTGDSLGFQTNDTTLINKMRKILVEHKNCIVCLPGIFKDESDYTYNCWKYWEKILVHKRKKWYSFCDKDYIYGNADITRCYMALENKEKSKEYFEKLKQIWLNRKVVIVEGEKTRLGVGNDLFDNCTSIQRILCPAINAYDYYNSIIYYIRDYFQTDQLILISLGPTATLMAYELAQVGYQAIDIGNIDKEYEWYKINAHKPIRNPIKFSMEVKGAEQVENCTDKEYFCQIIKRIGC